MSPLKPVQPLVELSLQSLGVLVKQIVLETSRHLIRIEFDPDDKITDINSRKKVICKFIDKLKEHVLSSIPNCLLPCVVKQVIYDN